MRRRDVVLLGGGPLFVGELRIGLRRILQGFQGGLGVFVNLGKLLVQIEIVLAGALGDAAGQHEHRGIILGVGFEGALGEDHHLFEIVFLLIRGGLQVERDRLEIGVGELEEQVLGGSDPRIGSLRLEHGLHRVKFFLRLRLGLFFRSQTRQA